ncbi:leishmanolysin-related zinc metalloendopeptidase [Methylomonas sp. MED-D]|uniref:VPLPA-CTERM sorting domain-containing protein n=1 Tax=Methylomonas sp. MED-D TaxID=3418768 RepID=UPI003D03D0C2
MCSERKWAGVAAGLMLAVGQADAASFQINLNFSGLTSEQESYFQDAAGFWESIITGYGSAVTDQRINGVTISASAAAIDGSGGTLGSAGPTQTWQSSRYNTGGYSLTRLGDMKFDTADIANMISNGTFLSVIEHEMAHVLGFGTLWEANGLYTSGSGQYTGEYGVAAYRSEFGQAGATYVPVEQGGGSGTADGHWNEVDKGAANTGIVDTEGHDMRYELMTGWLNAPAFLSNTTIQSFRDLGYSVVAPVPLPASLWMFAGALLGFVGLPGRRRSA